MADRCRQCGEERTPATSCKNGHWIGVPVKFTRTQEYTLEYMSRGMTEERFKSEGSRYWPGTDEDDIKFVNDYLQRWGRTPYEVLGLDPRRVHEQKNPLFD